MRKVKSWSKAEKNIILNHNNREAMILLKGRSYNSISSYRNRLKAKLSTQTRLNKFNEKYGEILDVSTSTSKQETKLGALNLSVGNVNVTVSSNVKNIHIGENKLEVTF